MKKKCMWAWEEGGRRDWACAPARLGCALPVCVRQDLPLGCLKPPAILLGSGCLGDSLHPSACAAGMGVGRTGCLGSCCRDSPCCPGVQREAAWASSTLHPLACVTPTGFLPRSWGEGVLMSQSLLAALLPTVTQPFHLSLLGPALRPAPAWSEETTLLL